MHTRKKTIENKKKFVNNAYMQPIFEKLYATISEIKNDASCIKSAVTVENEWPTICIAAMKGDVAGIKAELLRGSETIRDDVIKIFQWRNDSYQYIYAFSALDIAEIYNQTAVVDFLSYQLLQAQTREIEKNNFYSTMSNHVATFFKPTDDKLNNYTKPYENNCSKRTMNR